jgi:hypothetical protein
MRDGKGHVGASQATHKFRETWQRCSVPLAPRIGPDGWLLRHERARRRARCSALSRAVG